MSRLKHVVTNDRNRLQDPSMQVCERDAVYTNLPAINIRKSDRNWTMKKDSNGTPRSKRKIKERSGEEAKTAEELAEKKIQKIIRLFRDLELFNGFQFVILLIRHFQIHSSTSTISCIHPNNTPVHPATLGCSELTLTVLFTCLSC